MIKKKDNQNQNHQKGPTNYKESKKKKRIKQRRTEPIRTKKNQKAQKKGQRRIKR